jgi:hypothetical protein
MQTIEGHPIPANEGDLPLDITRDSDGKITKIRIDWKGYTLREQFPWTVSMADNELG